MSILLTAKDAHSFMNLLQAEAIGKDAQIQVADTSAFVSAGEAIIQTGMENTLNSLWLLIGKIWVASRKYNGKLKIVQSKDTGVFSHRMAKISTYSRRAIASGYFNTDANTNFAPGYDNTSNSGAGTKSMWEQIPDVSETFTFGGSKVYDFGKTIYIDKIEQAFRNEAEFNAFVNACAVEFLNDIEQYKENEARALIINRLAADIDMENDRPDSVVHCVTEFNQEFETSYTAKELQTIYAKDFYAWLASKIAITQSRLTERSVLYHWNPVKTVDGVDYDLLRHTPLADQKFIMLDPFMVKMETYVLPEIFHDNLLKIGEYERVSYWQNINDPAGIKATPAINETDSTSADYMTQKKGDAVDKQVIGAIFDRDALLFDAQLRRTLTSPVEARKGYYTTWVHVAFNLISDATENSVVFVLD